MTFLSQIDDLIKSFASALELNINNEILIFNLCDVMKTLVVSNILYVLLVEFKQWPMYSSHDEC